MEISRFSRLIQILNKCQLFAARNKETPALLQRHKEFSNPLIPKFL